MWWTLGGVGEPRACGSKKWPSDQYDLWPGAAALELRSRLTAGHETFPPTLSCNCAAKGKEHPINYNPRRVQHAARTGRCTAEWRWLEVLRTKKMSIDPLTSSAAAGVTCWKVLEPRRRNTGAKVRNTGRRNPVRSVIVISQVKVNQGPEWKVKGLLSVQNLCWIFWKKKRSCDSWSCEVIWVEERLLNHVGWDKLAF